MGQKKNCQKDPPTIFVLEAIEDRDAPESQEKQGEQKDKAIALKEGIRRNGKNPSIKKDKKTSEEKNAQKRKDQGEMRKGKPFHKIILSPKEKLTKNNHAIPKISPANPPQKGEKSPFLGRKGLEARRGVKLRNRSGRR